MRYNESIQNPIDDQITYGYREIYDLLKKDISNRIYNPGEKLPSENQLSTRFHIKRSIVRKAIHQLVQDELVYVIRNKGYYVRINAINVKLQKSINYTKNMLEIKLTPRVRLIDLKICNPTPEQYELFKLTTDEKLWEILVLRFYKNIPHLIGRSYLPFKRVPDFRQYYLKTMSIHQVLEEAYGIKPSRQSSVCKAILSDKKESKLLSIFECSPLLKVTSINVDQNGIPIEQCISKFRSDIVQLNINL